MLVVIFLVGCTTPYGPHGLTGGYDEKKLEEDSYIVSFYGNGHTSGQQVWNYWIYRCAELTVEKGYDFFSLTPSEEYALLDASHDGQIVEFEMLPDEQADSELQKVIYQTYTITTYSANAKVDMYKMPIDEKVDPSELLDASYVLSALEPYLKAKAGIAPPDKKLLIIRAIVEASIKAKNLNKEEAEKLRSVVI